MPESYDAFGVQKMLVIFGQHLSEFLTSKQEGRLCQLLEQPAHYFANKIIISETNIPNQSAIKKDAYLFTYSERIPLTILGLNPNMDITQWKSWIKLVL